MLFTIINISCESNYGVDEIMYFYAAIGKADYGKVKRYIKKYPKIVNSGIRGMGQETVPLIAALGVGDLDIVKLLLQNGADINNQDSKGISVLHAAIQGGNVEQVKLLVEEGADIKAKDHFGMNIYHYALYHPSIEMLNLLYKYNKNIDEPDNKERTPLAAIMADDRPGLDNITMWFLKRGADFSKVIKLAPDMVPVYIDEKRNEVVKYLIAHSSAYRNYVDHEGNTVSHFSVGLDNAEILNFLLENKYYSNKKNDKGETPLKMAKEIGRNDMAKKIEEYLAQSGK